MQLGKLADNAYNWHIVRVVDAVSTTVTVAQGRPSMIRYHVILSVVQKQKKKKETLYAPPWITQRPGKSIVTMPSPHLRALLCDQVNGLPEQVVHRALFRAERLLHAVLVCVEPRLDRVGEVTVGETGWP